MNRKGFVEFGALLLHPLFLFGMFLVAAYIFLRHYDITSMQVTLVMLGLFIGVVGNLFVDKLFFINFALIGLIWTYASLARHYIPELPQLPLWFLIFFSGYVIASLLSRFSRNITGVGT